MSAAIVRCVACDGYGWIDDPDSPEPECTWCGGIGYVYRDERGIDRRIPPADLAALSDTLERLETERLRELGYTGSARKPWEQAIRRARGDRLSELGGE
ncbi:MAG: hypothetical protein ACUVS2_18045 [Candidatus Flexifilum sp.]